VGVRFAHNAERQFAELLDFYGVRWEYEPRTFVLDRHPDGRPRRAFTPDFHLPDFDLFVELTTLRQSLVTRKNGKVRRLRELHPEVTVKVLYARDYQHLGARFGLEAPEQRGAAPDPVAPAAG
jgi:hypoxanthine phosphoribosyltransferase